MLKNTIRKAVFLATGVIVAFAMMRLAAAQPLPCSVGRTPDGNCGVTRVGPDLKIDEVAYNLNKSFTQVTVRGRGIGDAVGGGQRHDVRWATVTIVPGGFSRWHYHPGPNFLSMESGKAVYYTVEVNGKCTTSMLSANPADGLPGFVEIPAQVHTIHNTSADPVVIRVLFTKEPSDPLFTENAEQPTDPSCPQGYNP